MCQRHLIKIFIAGSAIFASSHKLIADQKQTNIQDKPNIILIMADDMGYGDMSCQGATDVRTPHIDQIAANGVRFTDGYATASVCSPSRAGMITGRYQQRFGHEANCPPKTVGMDITERTLGQAMQDQGYRTGVIGKWHLGNAEQYYPTNRGFDYFYGLRGGSRDYFPGKADRPGNAKAIEHNGQQVEFEGYLTDVFGDKAIEFIDDSKDQPFFLFLSFTCPHSPRQAKEEDLKLFPDLQKGRKSFAAMMWAMDRAIGKIVQKLENTGKLDNTIIWFISDNGGATGNSSSNKPLGGHKGMKFEGGIRVPFMVQWKNTIPAGQVYDQMVSALDIYPTCVAAAGGNLTQEKKIDGTNLIGYLTKEKQGAPHQKLYWHKLWFSAMRDGDWKLIYVKDYGYALYNVREDMREMNNLAKKMPERVATMSKDLDAWKATLVDPEWSEGDNWFKYHSKTHIRQINKGTPKEDRKAPISK